MSNDNYQTLHGFVDGGGGLCGGCGHTIAHPSHGKDASATAESASPAPQRLKSGEMRGFITYEHPEPVAAPQEVTRYGFVWNERKTHCQLFEHPDGGYVLYSDYAAKCAELQKAESSNVSLREEHDKMMQLMARLVEQWDEESAEAVRKAVKP